MTSKTSQTRKQRALEEVKKGRRRRTIYATGILAAVMVAVIVIAILLSGPHPQPSGSGLIGSPIPQSLYNNFTSVTPTTLAAIQSGTANTKPQSVSGPALTSNGKMEVFYAGAEYCPYCASERWSLILALSQFGTFTPGSLTYMMSSSTDTHPNTATFSFQSASYSSQYIAFASVEERDRNGNQLQTPTSAQQSLINTYDSAGSIPFIDIGNRYTSIGGTYDQSVIDGLNWTQIGSQLNNPSSPIAKAIDGEANNLITAICKSDGGQPASVCSQSFATLFMPLSINNMPPRLTGSNLLLGNMDMIICRRPVSFSY